MGCAVLGGVSLYCMDELTMELMCVRVWFHLVVVGDAPWDARHWAVSLAALHGGA